MSDPLPVTIYWVLRKGRDIVAIYPYEREREAKLHAEEERLTCVPAALQGWLIMPFPNEIGTP